MDDFVKIDYKKARSLRSLEKSPPHVLPRPRLPPTRASWETDWPTHVAPSQRTASLILYCRGSFTALAPHRFPSGAPSMPLRGHGADPHPPTSSHGNYYLVFDPHRTAHPARGASLLASLRVPLF